MSNERLYRDRGIRIVPAAKKYWPWVVGAATALGVAHSGAPRAIRNYWETRPTGVPHATSLPESTATPTMTPLEKSGRREAEFDTQLVVIVKNGQATVPIEINAQRGFKGRERQSIGDFALSTIHNTGGIMILTLGDATLPVTDVSFSLREKKSSDSSGHVDDKNSDQDMFFTASYEDDTFHKKGTVANMSPELANLISSKNLTKGVCIFYQGHDNSVHRKTILTNYAIESTRYLNGFPSSHQIVYSDGFEEGREGSSESGVIDLFGPTSGEILGTILFTIDGAPSSL